MSIKLVAIDLDDTLLDSGLKIAENCLQAITQVQQKGILVTLATGRMYPVIANLRSPKADGIA